MPIYVGVNWPWKLNLHESPKPLKQWRHQTSHDPINKLDTLIMCTAHISPATNMPQTCYLLQFSWLRTYSKDYANQCSFKLVLNFTSNELIRPIMCLQLFKMCSCPTIKEYYPFFWWNPWCLCIFTCLETCTTKHCRST